MSKGEQTRQMIIEQSAALFNKKGIAATAMSDIMDRLARMADEEAGKTKSVPEQPKN